MGVLGSPSPARLVRGTPRNAGEFPLVVGTYTATGVSVPPLSLDRWFAARNNHANQLAEIVVKGDSTMAGQVQPTDDATHHYSPVTRIRARLQGAGFTDGGHGLNFGTNDTPSVSGDAASGIVAQTGFAGSDSFVLPVEGAGVSATAGDSITYQGYGTHIRLFYRTSTIGGAWTYSVDGGTAVAGPFTNPLGNAYNYDFINIPGLTDGLHTVTITNTSGGSLNAACDFVKAAGIVLHNHSVRGAAATTGINQAQHREVELGLTPSASQTNAALQPVDNRTGVRRPCLYVFALGINNQQGAGGTDTSAALKGYCIEFGNAARAAGADFLIVIPAFESANQSQLAANYRQALKDAATTLAAPWVDIGLGGAIPTMTAGSTGNNPHLTQAQYTTQGDFIWDQVLGVV